MSRSSFILAVFTFLSVAGCGGAGGPRQTEFGYREVNAGGEKDVLYVQPSPEFVPNRPGVDPGVTPKIVIDDVLPFLGQVHPAGTGIYQPIDQMVYGRAFNYDPATARVVLYALTNFYYVQPLDNSYIFITNGTWLSASNPGKILALLVRDDFRPPATYPLGSPPEVNRTTILAVDSQP